MASTIEEVVMVLNDAWRRDQMAVLLLCNNRVQANEHLALSGTVQPRGDGPSGYTVSALDLLNGVIFPITGHRVRLAFDKEGEDFLVKGFEIAPKQG